MEDGGAPFTPGTSNLLRTLSDNNMDFDLTNDLFFDGYWLENANKSLFLQQVPSPSASDFPSFFFPTTETFSITHFNSDSHQKNFQQDTTKSNYTLVSPSIYSPMGDLTATQLQSWDASASSNQTVEVSENRRLWLGASEYSSPGTSLEKRLVQAFEHLKNTTRDRDVLIQIWVPIKREGRDVLTTDNQPFSVDPNSKSLEFYRNISSTYQFEADENSKEFFGLPGRVFLKKLPEWAPDVLRLPREDYPRISYAQKFNVRGSLAIPVFERGSGTCLAVVEIVSTCPKANYHSELDDVCKALEAVDLRSSEIFTHHWSRDQVEAYQAALAEIREVLTVVCDTHNLPLAQTWAPCTQQGKSGCLHYDQNSSCVSIIDSACYVPDKQVLGFHKECSKHHLVRGEGVAGGAFMTNQPCFTADIGAFSESEYPLAEHARQFGLHGAVAVRLRSMYTDLADFVLEFFLPLDCKDSEVQKQMLISLSSVIQQVSRYLRVVTDQELVEETQLLVREAVAPTDGGLMEEEETRLASSSSEEGIRDDSSWIADMMLPPQKDTGLSVYLGNQKEEPAEEFMVNALWNNTNVDLNLGPGLPEHIEIVEDGLTPTGDGEWSSEKGKRFPSAKKAGEQRRAKTERTICLQVLRQYFAGSLKDAATSLGVCPTTLKRICRQHGITRWPSRKIKKVGHSLKKLQLVIDSVQGSEGAIQLSSFYTSFPELSAPNTAGTMMSLGVSQMDDPSKKLHSQPNGGLLSLTTTASNSGSSSGSHSSSSSFCCSTGAKHTHVTASAPGGTDASIEGRGVLKRASSDAKLHELCQEDTKLLVRSQSHKIFAELPPHQQLPPFPKGNRRASRGGSSFRVKATFGEEKIRFSLPQHWVFGDLQGEIVRRFNVDDLSKFDLKYLDDDSEWILLTCNDDLEECIDIHRSSGSRTIKLSLRQASSPNLGSLLYSCAPS